MVRDVAFGQYFPANSVIHKCDPRAKLIMLVGFLVIIFCTFNSARISSIIFSIKLKRSSLFLLIPSTNSLYSSGYKYLKE